MLNILEIQLCCHLSKKYCLIVILSRFTGHNHSSVLVHWPGLCSFIDSQRCKLVWSLNNMDHQLCRNLSGLTLIKHTYWHSLCACHWPVWTQARVGIWSRLCHRALRWIGPCFVRPCSRCIKKKHFYKKAFDCEPAAFIWRTCCCFQLRLCY